MAISVVVPFNLVGCVLGSESDENPQLTPNLLERLPWAQVSSDMVSFKVKVFLTSARSFLMISCRYC